MAAALIGVLDSPGAPCANCGAELTGPYCARCGQKALDGPPTVREFLHDAADDVFNVDGRLWRTLKLLFLRPGALTVEAFHGRRASYVRPLRLYLTCSVLAFSVMVLTGDVVELEERDRDEMQTGVSVRDDRGAAIGVSSDDMTPEQLREMQQQVNDSLPTFMFLMVPAFAAIVMLVMRRSGRTYPQHLYFALHLHAFIFGTTAVLLLLNPLGRTAEGISAISRVVLSLGYGVAALRTAYGLRWWGAVWRGGVILAAYFLWMAIAILAIAMVYLAWWSTRVSPA